MCLPMRRTTQIVLSGGGGSALQKLIDDKNSKKQKPIQRDYAMRVCTGCLLGGTKKNEKLLMVRRGMISKKGEGGER